MEVKFQTRIHKNVAPLFHMLQDTKVQGINQPRMI